MKNIVFILLCVVLSTNAFSQNVAPLKFKSDIFRILNRKTESDEWKKTDQLLKQIIVFNSGEKIIKFYRGDSSSLFDVLTVMPKVEEKSISTWTFKCLDPFSNECTVDLVIMDNTPFYVMVKYPLKQLMYFITKE